MGKWFNSDHGSANMSSEVKAMLGQLEAIGLMSQAYNPQSKPVEAVIGKFEQSILRYYPNFAGGNRTAKKQDSFENSDVLKQMLKDGTLPTEEEGIFQFAQAIEVYNNEVVKGKSRMSRYRDGENLGLTVSELVLVDLLWVLRKDKGKYTKDGLIIEVEGERHIFEVESERGVEDAAFKRAYFNAPFEIRYNPEDLSAIHLYQDTVWVAKANAKYAFGKTPDQHEGKERELWQKRMTARVDEEKEALRFVADNRKAMADMNLQPVDFQMVFKDALNEIEEHLSMADYNRPQAAVSTIIKQHKAKVGLYDDDASFAIIE